MRPERLAAALNEAGVRYVVIGVAGANYWALSDRLFLATHAEALKALIERDD